MAVADEARCFGNSQIHGCCHLSKVFLGFLQAEAIEREEDQEWITLQLSNLWSGQLVLRNCWPGACDWHCRFHQMMSMNTLMFRECLVLSSKKLECIIVARYRYPKHHKESCLAVRHLQLPWHSECHLDSLDVPSVWVHRLQPNTRHSESDKSDSWLGPWDLLSSLSLDVFASAVTRSWESLFFKAASDLFFCCFKCQLRQASLEGQLCHYKEYILCDALGFFWWLASWQANFLAHWSLHRPCMRRTSGERVLASVLADFSKVFGIFAA